MRQSVYKSYPFTAVVPYFVQACDYVLIPLQSLFYNLSNGILLFFSYISPLHRLRAATPPMDLPWSQFITQLRAILTTGKSHKQLDRLLPKDDTKMEVTCPLKCWQPLNNDAESPQKTRLLITTGNLGDTWIVIHTTSWWIQWFHYNLYWSQLSGIIRTAYRKALTVFWGRAFNLSLCYGTIITLHFCTYPIVSLHNTF